jgi:hypothetical protein
MGRFVRYHPIMVINERSSHKVCKFDPGIAAVCLSVRLFFSEVTEMISIIILEPGEGELNFG